MSSELVLNILKDTSLTYAQKVIALARTAENSVSPIPVDDQLAKFFDQGIISDMYEGNAPYRPRYIVPNYDILMQKGCQFLDLEKPNTLEDALAALLVFYHHVPSITTFPVYIGELDALLDPFVQQKLQQVDLGSHAQEAAIQEIKQQLKRFLIHIDRTITDSFCHANLSGTDNLTARLFIELEGQLHHSVPNLTLKVGPQTSDDLLELAVKSALKVAKPSFAHHMAFNRDFNDRPYALVSCYNGLLIGGGSYTLVRLNLGELVKSSQNQTEFFDHLQRAVAAMLPYMDHRVQFLLEQSDFFDTHFLVKEGFIDQNNFTAMFGLVGLADAVNALLKNDNLRFGHSDQAQALGIAIIEAIENQVMAHFNAALVATQGHYVLHAQVGLDTDCGISPGCRIPIGDEPPIHEHLLMSAPFHKYFPSGIGDIFRFDETVYRNLKSAVDIIKGGFESGIRYMSLYEDNADVVRITGYLVKKSDIEKLRRGEQVINDAVVLGKGAVENQKVLQRKLRT